MQEGQEEREGRRRSFSEPLRPQAQPNAPLPTLPEGQTANAARVPAQGQGPPPSAGGLPVPPTPRTADSGSSRPGRMAQLRRTTSRFLPGVGGSRRPSAEEEPEELIGTDEQGREVHYDDNVVDVLDVLDPEISTLTTLTNVQNSLFLPDMGSFFNRRPTFNLTRQAPPTRPAPQRPSSSSESSDESDTDVEPASPHVGIADEATIGGAAVEKVPTGKRLRGQTADSGKPKRSGSITSAMSESRYAVLPHGTTLEGWSEDDKAELNDYVRHMLHSKRSKFKQSMKGFGKYVSKRASNLSESTYDEDALTSSSYRLLRHAIRISHNDIWIGMGTLLNR